MYLLTIFVSLTMPLGYVSTIVFQHTCMCHSGQSVVQALVNAFFFFLSKTLSQIIFSIVFSISKAKRIQLNWLFKLSYLSSKFALTLGYLNPTSNNPPRTLLGFATGGSSIRAIFQTRMNDNFFMIHTILYFQVFT